MIPCPSCGTHAHTDGCVCPHCGSKLCASRSYAPTLAIALLGLAAAGGCIGTTQPLYGVTVTDTVDTNTDTDDTGDTSDTGT